MIKNSLKTHFIVLLTFLAFCKTSFAANIDATEIPRAYRPSIALPLITPDRIGEIASYVRSTLREKTDSEIFQMMKKHYETLRLFKNGRWTSEEFSSLSETLLPPCIGVTDCINLVDEMARIAKRNSYLCEMLNALSEQNIEGFKNKVQYQANALLPDVVAYAMVLEKLTTHISRNVELMEAADKIWNNARESVFLPKYFSLFEIVKLYSLSFNSTIKALRTKTVDPDCFRYGLSMNILEAAIADKWYGHHDNAYAGWVLATNPAGGEYNPKTQAGPAFISSSLGSPMLHVRTPFTKFWNDLYTVWNLSFVSSYPHFPYVMTKLLIPTLHREPSLWTFHRLISLTTQVNFELFSRVDALPMTSTMNWYHKPLTRHFGFVNARSAAKFQEMIDKLSPNFL